MTVAVRTAATRRVPMDSLRKTTLVAGVLYLLSLCLDPVPGPERPGARSEPRRRPVSSGCSPPHAQFASSDRTNAAWCSVWAGCTEIAAAPGRPSSFPVWTG